jgi:tyrosine-protein kinase Etk/Wzc
VDGLRGSDKPVLDVWLTWRRLVYRVFIAAAVISVVVSLIMPNWYAGRSTFLPPQDTEETRSFLQLSSLMGVNLGSTGLLSDTPMLDVMIGVLRSRRLRAELVDEFDLTRIYRAKSREHAIDDLEDHVFVNNTAEGLIEVKVEARTRDRAAAMTNALVALLDSYNRETSVEQARRTSEFISGYLSENERRLEEAARATQRFQEEHGAVELSEQTRVTVEAAAELMVRKTKLEIERGVLEQYASPDQARMVEIDMEIAQIDDMLDRFTAEGDTSGLSVFVALGSVPKVGFELARLTRDVEVYEKIHEYLTAQFEQSRIQEAKDLQTVRVVDVAVPPLKKARPRRSVIVILTVAIASIAAVGLAFACEGILAREEEWTRGDLVSAPPEIRWAVRAAHRLARWVGVE